MSLNRTIEYIKNEVGEIPKIAFMIDSGMTPLYDEIKKEKIILYKNIPNFPQLAGEGKKGKIIIGELANKRILIFWGRHYYYEGFGMEEIVYPVEIITKLGIKVLLICQKASSLNKRYTPGDIMIAEDHISFFCPSPLRGVENISYVSMKNCYDLDLIEMAKLATIELKIDVKLGVLAFLSGPTGETKAENRALMNMGIDAACMTGVPEAIYAHYNKIKVISVSAITNMATGVDIDDADRISLVEVLRKLEKNFLSFVKSFIVHFN